MGRRRRSRWSRRGRRAEDGSQRPPCVVFCQILGASKPRKSMTIITFLENLPHCLVVEDRPGGVRRCGSVGRGGLGRCCRRRCGRSGGGRSVRRRGSGSGRVRWRWRRGRVGRRRCGCACGRGRRRGGRWINGVRVSVAAILIVVWWDYRGPRRWWVDWSGTRITDQRNRFDATPRYLSNYGQWRTGNPRPQRPARHNPDHETPALRDAKQRPACHNSLGQVCRPYCRRVCQCLNSQ